MEERESANMVWSSILQEHVISAGAGNLNRDHVIYFITRARDKK